MIHPCMTLTTSKRTLIKESSAHGEAQQCPKAPLVNKDEPEEPAVGSIPFAKGVQEKGDNSLGFYYAEKELVVNKVDGEMTEEQPNNNLELRPPKDLADLKKKAFSEGINFWKFKQMPYSCNQNQAHIPDQYASKSALHYTRSSFTLE